jgi:hypothetical protein
VRSALKSERRRSGWRYGRDASRGAGRLQGGQQAPRKDKQYPPGVSGNPSGRRKVPAGGSALPRKSLKTIVLASLETKRSVLVNGKRRTMTNPEMLIERALAWLSGF